MYLTSSGIDIMFTVCACARYQVNPKVSYLHAMKRIFRYLKGQPKLDLWYPKDYPFDLVAYTDSDYAGASLDRKSTTGGYQFLGCRLISWQCKKQTMTKIHIDNKSTICIVKNPIFHSKTKHIEIRHHFIRDSNEKKLIQMIKIHTDQNVAYLLTKAFDVSRFQYLIAMDKKKVIITESTIRRDLQLEDANGVDCLPNAAIFEQLTLMGYEKLSQKLTFYKAFFSPQWKFLIHTILQCLSAKTTAWNEFSSTMASAIICLATNQKFNFSKYIFDNMVKNVDSMILGNMKREGKGFFGRVTPLFQTMMVQAHEEMGEGSEIPTDPHHTPIIKPSILQPQKKQSRRKQRKDIKIPQSSGPTKHIVDKIANEKNFEEENQEAGKEKEVKNEGLGDKEDASKQGRKIADIDADVEVRLIDETQGRNDDNLIFDTIVLDKQEVEVEKVVSTAEVTTKSATTTIVDELTLAQTFIEIKAEKTQNIRLQAQFDKEERIAREKEEANTALIAQWNDIQDKVEIDYELAQRLQAEEQEELTIEEKSKLFQQLLEKRKKQFTAKRAKEKRRWKPKDLQNKSFASVQELFENAMKMVNTFLDIDIELVEGSEIREEESSSKKVGDELEQEPTKNQKIDDDKERRSSTML
ncbi:hypothetical protein Tco_0806504 [Tanacetum coccineum]